MRRPYPTVMERLDPAALNPAAIRARLRWLAARQRAEMLARASARRAG